MGNYKRRKSRRNISCVLCTQHRWRANSSGRFKAREEAERKLDLMDGEVPARSKSAKKNWSCNKSIRALKNRISSIGSKRADWEMRRRGSRNKWTDMLLASYDAQIARCERELAVLEKERRTLMKQEHGEIA